jgi:hypothetical protein
MKATWPALALQSFTSVILICRLKISTKRSCRHELFAVKRMAAWVNPLLHRVGQNAGPCLPTPSPMQGQNQINRVCLGERRGALP